MSCAALCLLLRMLLLPAAAFAEDEPIHVIEGTLIELGVVEPGVYRGELHVVNHRTYPVRVDVRSGDGGFWGVIDTDPIPPGDTAIITVTWDFNARNGLLWKSLSLYCSWDSGYNYSMSVLFVAYVHRDIRMSKTMFLLVGMSPDTTVRDTIELKSECNTAVTILAPVPVSIGEVNIIVKFPEGNRIEPGKSLRIVAEGRLKRHPGSIPFSHGIPLETVPSINTPLELRLLWLDVSASGRK